MITVQAPADGREVGTVPDLSAEQVANVVARARGDDMIVSGGENVFPAEVEYLRSLRESE